MWDILKHLPSQSQIRELAYMWDRLIFKYVLYLQNCSTPIHWWPLPPLFWRYWEYYTTCFIPTTSVIDLSVMALYPVIFYMNSKQAKSRWTLNKSIIGLSEYRNNIGFKWDAQEKFRLWNKFHAIVLQEHGLEALNFHMNSIIFHPNNCSCIEHLKCCLKGHALFPFFSHC